MTTTDDTTPRPLRFWLKAAAGRLADELDAALRSEALDRREWRLLKGLARADSAALQERLADRPHGLERLTHRGWVAQGEDGWQLTDDGRAGLERVSARSAAIRDRVSAAVSPDDLAVTTASLEAIARELGWEEGQHHRRDHHRGHRRGHREGPRPHGQHHPHEQGHPHLRSHGHPHTPDHGHEHGHHHDHPCAPRGRTLEG